MEYKKQKWMDYGNKKGIIEFILRDQSGAKTGNFKATNQRDYGKVLNLIKEKTGYKPEIKKEDSISISEEIEWLKKENNW